MTWLYGFRTGLLIEDSVVMEGHDSDWMWSLTVCWDLCKREVLHFGQLNARENYTVNGKILHVQGDLWVQVQSSLKVATQVDTMVKEKFMGRCIEYKGH